MAGRISLYSARLSALGCVGTLVPEVFWLIHLFVVGPPNLKMAAIHGPHSVSLLERGTLACLALWISAALVGLIGGLLARGEVGVIGLKWSVVLICLLPLVWFFIAIAPKS